jgi:2'-5' RNA ligase
VRTVELLPDDTLEAEVRAVWAKLAAAGLPSLASHPHPTNRPHLTLAAGEWLPDLRLDLPVPVTLDGLLLFDGSGMLVWRVTPSPQLSALQARVWAALDDPNPLREPSRWIPHVSLARHFRTDFTDFDPGVRHGHFVAARSYDSATRTVTELSRPG